MNVWDVCVEGSNRNFLGLYNFALTTQLLAVMYVSWVRCMRTTGTATEADGDKPRLYSNHAMAVNDQAQLTA
jgi:hypothetical protein